VTATREEVIALLKAARARISDPKHWTTGTWARKGGEPCPSKDPEAECWCALGALSYAKPANASSGLWTKALVALWPDLKWGDRSDGIAGFNDFNSHEEVLMLFDTAISRLLGGGA
jgi:hypothetical protein